MRGAEDGERRQDAQGERERVRERERESERWMENRKEATDVGDAGVAQVVSGK